MLMASGQEPETRQLINALVVLSPEDFAEAYACLRAWSKGEKQASHARLCELLGMEEINMAKADRAYTVLTRRR